MKGKNKYRYRGDKDWLTSDDEMFSRSSSPIQSSIMIMGQSSYKSDASYSLRTPEIKPRNEMQTRYLNLLETPHPPIVIAAGPAGVAKTYLCNAVGIKKLIDGSVDKLIITRPAVSVDEEHGFLPGTLEEKMDPWLRPIYDVFYKFVSPATIKNMIAKQQIEICPLAYMRGRTFDNAWICADEMQNSTTQQMLMLLTRIGANSKLVITGDPQQHDRGYVENGLNDFIKRMHRSDRTKNIELVQFTEDHVERHPVIREILRMYPTPDSAGAPSSRLHLPPSRTYSSPPLPAHVPHPPMHSPSLSLPPPSPPSPPSPTCL